MTHAESGFETFSAGLGLNALWRPSSAQSRSITPENPTGEKGSAAMAAPDPGGPARDLGVGWKCKPSIEIALLEERELAVIEGPGVLRSIWFGGALVDRDAILRMYWDGQSEPSVECPIPDFFGVPWARLNRDAPASSAAMMLNSVPVAVNPNLGVNCYWPMPFARKCRITVENRTPTHSRGTCFQINYDLVELPRDIEYFHAQFRRENPLPYREVHTILDGVCGRGKYVGTVLGVGVHHNGWWGEGEVKFYIDGDVEHPTICATGTEDYFGGAFNWEIDGRYVPYSTPFLGMPTVVEPDGTYEAQHRHSMYRWHILDPVHFSEDLRVTIQALGWRSDGRFLPGQHDMNSVAYWYQTLPTAPFPTLADRDALEIT